MSAAYPLMWPVLWPRTELKDRVIGKHRLWRVPVNGQPVPWTFAATLKTLEHELELLGAENILVTSDFLTDARGNAMSGGRRPTDQGIAVHFQVGGSPMVIAYDAYLDAEANMRSLALALVAIRSIGLHGGGHILLRALVGFAATTAGPASATMHETPFHHA